MSLKEKYREVIVLYYLEEYSVTEIAKIKKKSVSTVTPRLQRGRQRLLSEMKKEDDYNETRN